MHLYHLYICVYIYLYQNNYYQNVILNGNKYYVLKADPRYLFNAIAVFKIKKMSIRT